MSGSQDWMPGEDVDLRRIFAILMNGKWVILGVPILVSLLALVAVRYLTPVYSSTAKIMIESVQANLVSIEELYGLDRRNAQYYDTQFEILRSRPLAEMVVEKLDLTSHPEYRLEEVDEETAETGIVADLKQWLQPGEADARPLDPFQRAVAIYMENVQIQPVPRTQLVDVVFESHDPELAAAAANTHAQSYIESSLDARLGMTETAITWMSTRLDELRQSLDQSERLLQEFRESEGVIDENGLKSLPSQQINDLTARLVEVRRRVGQARSAFFQVYPDGGARLATDLDGVSAILDDRVSQDFQRSVVLAERRVDELSRRLEPSHPTMIEAVAEFDKARQNLRDQHRRVAQTIRYEYESALGEERELVAELDQAKQRYQEMGRKEAEFIQLQRDVETNRELYDMFYSRIKETSQTGDLQQAEARVLSPAVAPIKPIRPNRNLIVGAAFVASAFIAVLSAFVVEALNDSVNVTNAERKLGLPMLSMVPKVRRKRRDGSLGTLISEPGHRIFKEAIRTVRTGISLHNPNGLSQAILITSSVSGEGKTTVSLNLAQSFAHSERVVLIDADMRKPSVAENLQIESEGPGLAELLGGNASIDDCILRDATTNLDVIAAGNVPEDPLQLLGSGRVASMMHVLRSRYDRIIVDSPPSLPVSDSPILSSHVDAVIYVVRAKSTRLVHITKALAKLQRVSAPLIGSVVNSWEMQKDDLYGAYGYYGRSPDTSNVVVARKLAS